MADPFDALVKLERFVHIGNSLPVYVRKKEYIPTAYYTNLKPMLALIDGESFVKLMEIWTKHKSFPRKDELWFTYAGYLIGDASSDHKTKVRDLFPKVAPEPEDLFLFARYAIRILKNQSKKGFSKTVRKAIILWYRSKTEEQLVEYLGCHRSMHGFRHRDLIVLSHVNLTKLNLHHVAIACFKRCRKFIEMADFSRHEHSDNIKKMRAIAQLKICEDVEQAKELIQSYNLTIENVPQNLYSCPDIWELVIPKMRPEQLLRSCSFVVDNKMFANSSFEMGFLSALGKVKKAKIHPIVYLVEKNKQIKQERYSEKIKSCYYTKKIQKKGIKPHKPLTDLLEKNFEQSFRHIQPSGLRVFITINLQESYNKRFVKSQNQVTYFEAAVTLALSYLRSERFCAVYTFTANPEKLTQLPWSKEYSYQKAADVCKSFMNKKTCQRTFIPFMEASTKKHAYDLFITIVPSAARGNPGNKPYKLLKAIHDYKTNHNKRAKMVIVNLGRFKPAMIHSLTEKGEILEICGFDENTPKLINAFGLGHFQ